MRRRRYSRVLLVFLCVLTLVSVFLYFENQLWAPSISAVTNRERIVPRKIVAAAAPPRPEYSSDVDPRIDKPPQNFSHRLRCIGSHREFGHLLRCRERCGEPLVHRIRRSTTHQNRRFAKKTDCELLQRERH